MFVSAKLKHHRLKPDGIKQRAKERANVVSAKLKYQRLKPGGFSEGCDRR